MKIKRLVLIAGLAILFLYVVLQIHRRIPYVRDYHAKLGVEQLAQLEALIDVFGEPTEITSIDRTHSVVSFGGVEFVLIHEPYLLERTVVVSTRVLDPNIRFGWHRIGVGSTRGALRRAYWRFRDPWGEHENQIIVVDGFAWIVFHMDDNGRVARMTITLGGP